MKTLHSIYTTSAMIIATILIFAPSHGAVVAVSNHSFELGGFVDGGVQNSFPNGFGWSSSGSPAGTTTGFYNPSSGYYAGAGGSGTPAGADGAQVGFLYKSGATVFQTLPGADNVLGNADDPVLMALTNYTLTLAVGHRLVGNPAGNFPFGTVALTLLAGSTVIAENSNITSPASGQFVEWSIAVDSSTLNPALYGQALSIRMRQMAVAESVADMDNVRLDATLVPEPTSVMLTSAGAIFLGIFRLRRMRRSA